MSRRALVAGESAYPFVVQTVGVRRRNREATPYDCLLLLSDPAQAFRLSNAGLQAGAEVFERLCQTALRGLLGPASKSVRFAWPSDEGRPPGFPEAIRWLGQRMGVPLGQAYRPPRRKDGGVDIVAWRPFPDGRRGFPIILIQCTLQADYVAKSHDIDLRTWAGWLAFDSDPLTALAIPFAVPTEEMWNEMAANVVVLDRLRLVSLIVDSGKDVPAATTWASAQLSSASLEEP